MQFVDRFQAVQAALELSGKDSLRAIFALKRTSAELRSSLRPPEGLPELNCAELPDQGSFVTREVAGERVLVVRGDDGALRAFFNVCRHRGSRLVDEPGGRLRGAIACPYHAWTYALDGSLRRAPQMDAAAGAPEWSLVSMPLVSVRVESILGVTTALVSWAGSGAAAKAAATASRIVRCMYVMMCLFSLYSDQSDRAR